jgi:hypothetical protein
VEDEEGKVIGKMMGPRRLLSIFVRMKAGCGGGIVMREEWDHRSWRRGQQLYKWSV